jgi:hypothetical protein
MSNPVSLVIHLDEVEADLLAELASARGVEGVPGFIHAGLVERLVFALEEGEAEHLGIDTAPYSDYLARKQAEDMARRNAASRARWARMFG